MPIILFISFLDKITKILFTLKTIALHQEITIINKTII